MLSHFVFFSEVKPNTVCPIYDDQSKDSRYTQLQFSNVSCFVLEVEFLLKLAVWNEAVYWNYDVASN